MMRYFTVFWTKVMEQLTDRHIITMPKSYAASMATNGYGEVHCFWMLVIISRGIF